jgi:predicted nucleic acid-binding protein
VKYLLDTCVLSEFVRPKPAQSLIHWLRTHDESLMGISVISLGEIQSGIACMQESRRRNSLQTWLDDELIPRFETRIISVEQKDALMWGKLTGEGKALGQPLPSTHALLAATASTRGLTMVSRNEKEFIRYPVKLINPWAGG